MSRGYSRSLVFLVIVVCCSAAFVDARSRESIGAPCSILAAKRPGRLGAFRPRCDEDGYFLPVQQRGSVQFCSSKTGKDLSFMSSVVNSEEKNCQCAADQHEFDAARVGRKLICDRLGNYEKVQCEGSMCYCSSSNGTRIEDTETHIDNFYSMHCGCAVAQFNFRQTRRVGLQFNCDSMGNYNSIQCKGSGCYCVDTFGEKIDGTLAHVSQYSSIICPNSTVQTTFQPCKTQILEDLQKKRRPGSIHYSCDELGYFNLVQMRGSMLLCVSPDGKYLGYPTRVGHPDAAKKTCQCAADMYAVSSDSYVAASPKCDNLGNYKPRQCDLDECYCVDANGERVASTDCL